jgi:hypothetical protein
MKNFELTIKWDRIRQGEFPTEEIKQIDNITKINVEKLSAFKQKVTIKTLIEENENELEVAYELGGYIHSITSRT